jgi:cytoplasmic iron level regulating protein YaaA (DUF328/UPF0246 family)
MRILLSPAKTLDLDSPVDHLPTSEPVFGEEAEQLIATLRRKSARSLMELMGISPDLASLNRERFQAWTWPHEADGSRPALWTFKGDVYLGLDAGTLRKRDVAWADRHLRILSGLYGILKPLDRIMPYRLEMGTRLKTRRGGDLYQFWKDRIRVELEHELADDSRPLLVNLASNEYFKAVQPGELSVPVITPVFKDWNRGQFRVLSFFAKQARGMMARFAIDRQVKDVEQLKDFDRGGYGFDEGLSSDFEWVFTRTSKD